MHTVYSIVYSFQSFQLIRQNVITKINWHCFLASYEISKVVDV